VTRSGDLWTRLRFEFLFLSVSLSLSETNTHSVLKRECDVGADVEEGFKGAASVASYP
jgi:hypothetical protein